MSVLCLVVAFGFAAPVTANPNKVNVTDLFAHLTKDKPDKTLTGRDFKQHPKLAAIVVTSDVTRPITSAELVQRISDHVAAYKRAFSAIDINKDGRISPVEIAQRSPKLLVYFPYLDLNRDGFVTLNELLSSRIFFPSTVLGQGQQKSISVSCANLSSQAATSIRPPPQVEDTFIPIDVCPTALEIWEASEGALLAAFFHKDVQKEGEPERLEPVVVTGPRFVDDDWELPDFGYEIFPAPEPPGCIDGQCVDKAKCDADYDGDIAICNMMHIPATPARQICYGIAFAVYSNCLRGR